MICNYHTNPASQGFSSRGAGGFIRYLKKLADERLHGSGESAAC